MHAIMISVELLKMRTFDMIWDKMLGICHEISICSCQLNLYWKIPINLLVASRSAYWMQDRNLNLFVWTILKVQDNKLKRYVVWVWHQFYSTWVWSLSFCEKGFWQRTSIAQLFFIFFSEHLFNLGLKALITSILVNFVQNLYLQASWAYFQ